MIQNIYPNVFNNAYKNIEPQSNDYAILINNDEVYLCYENNQFVLPTIANFDIEEYVYLFSINDNNYFLIRKGTCLNNKYEKVSTKTLRQYDLDINRDIFAIYSAYHLSKWYDDNIYCGKCKTKLIHHDLLRALKCPNCNNMIFPRLNPAVIVGVINNDEIVLTKYKAGFNQNALVAGFCEFGETLEDTVRREVKEEVGLNVKNIRYYKSQPWGIVQDLLVGFYCDVDGDTTIKMDNNELKSAIWTKKEDIILQDKQYSLTNEMMTRFKQGHKC